MVRKGRLEEIFSKAMHADNPELYTVAYRDYEEIKELPLLEFFRASENLQIIPASRILYVRRLNETIYRKSR